MTCKDCIHYGVCWRQQEFLSSREENEDQECCEDASKYIKLPCKVGQTVFYCTCCCDTEGEEKFNILEGEVISFSIQKEGLWAYCRYKRGLTFWHLVEQDFGKTVFLTREEAEKALAEMMER